MPRGRKKKVKEEKIAQKTKEEECEEEKKEEPKEKEERTTKEHDKEENTEEEIKNKNIWGNKMKSFDYSGLYDDEDADDNDDD